MIPNSIPFAIIGYGSAAQTIHLPLIAFEPRLRLRGVFTRSATNRELAKTKHGCIVYDTLDDALSDKELELVLITTPHDSHAAIAIEALKAGKHVVVDKPMCLTSGECARMIAAQKSSGKLLTVFHNARLSGDFLTLQSVIASKQLGQLKWLELNWNRHGLSKRSAWRNVADSAGGRLIDLGVHLIDQALLVFSQKVASVYTRMNRDWPGADVESACSITIGFEDGCTAIIDVGSMTRYPKPKYIAVGTEATWSKPPNLWDPQEPALASGDFSKNVEPEDGYGTLITETGATKTPTIQGDWRRFYHNLAGVLLDGAEPMVTLEEMRRVIAVMEAAIESGKRSDVIRL